MKIPLLAVRKGLVIVDKPAGISVHNASGKDLCSRAADLIRENRDVGTIAQPDPDFGVNPVHRLDKETSGIMLLAVNRDMFRFLTRQFESRLIEKEYVALLHGNLDGPLPRDRWASWKWPLSKAAAGRSNPAGTGKRLPSETRYRTLAYSRHYTMAAVQLHSGRTHQIRRHAKLSGHPVVGDARYGSNRAIRYLREKMHFDRLALHARSLTLSMGPDEAPQTIESRNVPDAIMDLFNKDRISIRPVDPCTPEISSMIADLDAYQASLYPPESNHLVDVGKLAGSNYYVIAAMDGRQTRAIASFKRTNQGYAEIKRLYVPEKYRGSKLASRLMDALEKKARQEGFAEVRLETGIYQLAAIKLYEKRGYKKIAPFGAYQEDPLSVFMGKKL